MEILYSLKNIELGYRAIESVSGNRLKIAALTGLTLDIYRNELLVILGANGSGKSSLGKLLAGLADGFTGDMYYQGRKVESYKRELFSDTTMVLQEPQNQLLMPSVAKELAYPLENRYLAADKIAEKAGETAGYFGLNQLLDKSPDQLSGGQITSLALASALITDPSTIILDEPDSHFDEDRESKLLEFIENNRGSKTIVLITQYIKLAQIADRVAIMHNGKIAAIGKPSEILDDKARLAEANLIADENNSDITKDNIPISSQNTIISLSNISYSYPDNQSALSDISLDILTGERLGIHGEIGSGKTTLGLIIAGLIEPVSGKATINEKPLDSYPERELRRLITMSLQFPERAVFEDSVGADIAFGPGNLELPAIDSIVDNQLRDFGIDHLRNRHPFTLSGGEKRKAALAGIFAMNTQVVILDEPTAALDPKSYRSLIEMITKCEAKTFILISHDLDFLKSTCHRLIELREGRIITNG